jgi:hypothetical protein
MMNLRQFFQRLIARNEHSTEEEETTMADETPETPTEKVETKSEKIDVPEKDFYYADELSDAIARGIAKKLPANPDDAHGTTYHVSVKPEQADSRLALAHLAQNGLVASLADDGITVSIHPDTNLSKFQKNWTESKETEIPPTKEP